MLISKKEAAAMFGVSAETIRRLIGRGDIPAYRIGGQVRIDPAALERYLMGQQMAAQAPHGSEPDAGVAVAKCS